jgi:U4/U6.U5 tri-snRNP-associated protein 1
LFERVRNRRELNASLKGATLGDADGDVDDVKKWLKRSKKAEKELAKKRMQELENMDRVFQGDEYTESALTLFFCCCPFQVLINTVQ